MKFLLKTSHINIFKHCEDLVVIVSSTQYTVRRSDTDLAGPQINISISQSDCEFQCSDTVSPKWMSHPVH